MHMWSILSDSERREAEKQKGKYQFDSLSAAHSLNQPKYYLVSVDGLANCIGFSCEYQRQAFLSLLAHAAECPPTPALVKILHTLTVFKK
jgi:hypothetical protein